MTIKLIVKQNGQTKELAALQNSVVIDANGRMRFELVDDAGHLIQNYQTHMMGDKLLIDLPNTSFSPDFIINNYTTYFGLSPVGNTGAFGASDTVASVVQHTTTSSAPAVATVDTEMVTSGSVKASTVESSSGLPTVGAIGLGALAVAGVALAVSKNSSSDDKPKTSNHDSGSNSHSQNNTNHQTNHTNPNSGSNAHSLNHDNGNELPNRTALPSSDNDTVERLVYQKDVLHGNKIILPDTFTKEILRGNDIKAISRAAENGENLNHYVHSEADKKIIIADLNYLPREIQTEISLFVANLLNPIREKWQVGLFKVSDGAMNFARDVANEYTANNKSIFNLNGHYVAGITRVASKYGLNNADNYYENMGSMQSSRPIKNLTLDDLKMEIYDSIMRMLFHDEHSQHGHAKSLLNCMGEDKQNLAADYLGVDISSINSHQLAWHFISVTDNEAYIIDSDKFNKTIVTNDIVDIAHSKMPQAYMLIDEDNSYLSTNQLNHHETTEPHIIKKFVFNKLLDTDIRQLSHDYDDEDVLVLDSKVFTVLHTDKSNLNQHITYESDTGKLQYDADGLGGEPAVIIAQLPTGLQENQLHFEVI